MIERLQHKYALSEKGTKDMFNGIKLRLIMREVGIFFRY